jgi:hypothetical protein
VPVDRGSKQARKKERGAAGMPRPTRKIAKVPPDEELSPERRVELAQEAEAKQFRGKPPSI